MLSGERSRPGSRPLRSQGSQGGAGRYVLPGRRRSLHIEKDRGRRDCRPAQHRRADRRSRRDGPPLRVGGERNAGLRSLPPRLDARSRFEENRHRWAAPSRCILAAALPLARVRHRRGATRIRRSGVGRLGRTRGRGTRPLRGRTESPPGPGPRMCVHRCSHLQRTGRTVGGEGPEVRGRPGRDGIGWWWHQGR